ncbi:hypothetical protein BH09PLA1_BH09PLA1_17810 [soil metagenome]
MLCASLSVVGLSGFVSARADAPGAGSSPATNSPATNSPATNSAATKSLASKPPATQPAPIDQSKIDAAMDRLRERQQQRAENSNATQQADASKHHSEKTSALKPTAARGNSPLQATLAQLAFDLYPRDLVILRKLELIRSYDKDIALARQALRRREIRASDVRELADEQAALQSLSIDQFRQLMIDADERNAKRIERYQQAFGDLNHAAGTVVTILMKAGLIDTAQPLPDDPLSEELELARGVRRVYYHFILPTNDGLPRRHNGYVEFQLAAAQGLWLPTWAELENGPIPLFDAEAFVPLQPYKIVYDGEHFVVAQVMPPKPLPLFSLLSPRNGSFLNSNLRQQRLFAPDRP